MARNGKDFATLFGTAAIPLITAFHLLKLLLESKTVEVTTKGYDLSVKNPLAIEAIDSQDDVYKNEIAQLQELVKQLEQKTTVLEFDLKTTQLERDTVKIENDNLRKKFNEEVTILNATIQEKDNKQTNDYETIRVLQNELQSSNVVKNKLRDELEVMKNEMITEQEDNTRTMKELQEHHIIQMERFKVQISELEKDNKALRTENESNHIIIVQQKDEIVQLQQQINNLTCEHMEFQVKTQSVHDEMKQQYEDKMIQQQKELQNDHVQQMDSMITDLKEHHTNELNSLQLDLDNVQTKNATLETENKKLQEQLYNQEQQYKQDIIMKEEELVLQLKTIEANGIQINTLQDELDTLQNDKKEVSEIVQEKEYSIHFLNEKLSTVRSEHDVKMMEHENMTNDLNEQIHHLTELITHKEEELIKERTTSSIQQQELNNVQKQVHQLQRSLEIMSSDNVKELDTTRNNYITEMKQRDNEFCLIRDLVEELETKLVQQEQEKNELHNMVQIREKVIVDQQIETDMKHDQFKRTLHDLTIEKDALEFANSTIMTELGQVKNDIVQVRKEYETLLAKKEEVIASQVQTLQENGKEVAALEEHLDQYKDAIQQLQETSSTLQEELINTRSKLETLGIEKEDQKIGLECQIEKLNDTIKEKDNEMKHDKKIVLSTQHDLDVANQTVDWLRKEIDLLKLYCNDKVQAISVASDNIKQLEAEIVDLHCTMTSRENEVTLISKEADTLRISLVTLEADKIRLEERIKELEIQIREYRNILCDRIAAIDLLEDEKDNLIETVLELSNEVDNLDELKSNYVKENNKLTEIINEANKQMSLLIMYNGTDNNNDPIRTTTKTDDTDIDTTELCQYINTMKSNEDDKMEVQDYNLLEKLLKVRNKLQDITSRTKLLETKDIELSERSNKLRTRVANIRTVPSGTIKKENRMLLGMVNNMENNETMHLTPLKTPVRKKIMIHDLASMFGEPLALTESIHTRSCDHTNARTTILEEEPEYSMCSTEVSAASSQNSNSGECNHFLSNNTTKKDELLLQDLKVLFERSIMFESSNHDDEDDVNFNKDEMLLQGIKAMFDQSMRQGSSNQDDHDDGDDVNFNKDEMLMQGLKAMFDQSMRQGSSNEDDEEEDNKNMDREEIIIQGLKAMFEQSMILQSNGVDDGEINNNNANKDEMMLQGLKLMFNESPVRMKKVPVNTASSKKDEFLRLLLDESSHRSPVRKSAANEIMLKDLATLFGGDLKQGYNKVPKDEVTLQDLASIFGDKPVVAPLDNIEGLL